MGKLEVQSRKNKFSSLTCQNSKFLCCQIKRIIEGAPEGCTINDSWTGQVSKLFGSHFCENHLNDVSRSPDSSAHGPHLVHQLPCNGNSTETDTEWIEQVEHGFYITLFRSPAGHKYFRRVHFSKRRFTEQQAAGGRNTVQHYCCGFD